MRALIAALGRGQSGLEASLGVARRVAVAALPPGQPPVRPFAAATGLPLVGPGVPLRAPAAQRPAAAAPTDDAPGPSGAPSARQRGTDLRAWTTSVRSQRRTEAASGASAGGVHLDLGDGGDAAFWHIATAERLAWAMQALTRGPGPIALDCEGTRLSRSGPLALLQLCSAETPRRIFLVDVVALGAEAFGSGLRELLENPSKSKIMYDCRRDSEALWHQYGVRLAGVEDVQLLELAVRRAAEDAGDRVAAAASSAGPSGGFGVGAGGGFEGGATSAQYLMGLAKCTETYLKGTAALDRFRPIKVAVGALFAAQPALWAARPLDPRLAAYAANDVALLHGLRARLLGRLYPRADDWLVRVRAQSVVSLSALRDLPALLPSSAQLARAPQL